MAFPTTKTTFTDPSGTSLLTNPDHAADHTAMHDLLEQMQDTYGTTAGTNITKNFAVGDFPARINASNVLQQRISGTIDNAVLGTVNITNGTINLAQFTGGTIDASTYTGGTLTGQIVNSGTVSGGVYGTAQYTGGTASSLTLDTPVIRAWNGWEDCNETWSTSGADTAGKTGTITVAADVTTKYSEGMKVKYTQGGTAFYGFISKTPTLASGTTTFTIFTGTATPGTTAITVPFYSTTHSPFGFSQNPDDWTVTIISDTATRSQTSPVTDTWYNLGTLNGAIPIGKWRVLYQCSLIATRTSGDLGAYVTLSTANNSESNTAYSYSFYASALAAHQTSIQKELLINLTTKTTHYLNAKTGQSSISSIDFIGGQVTTLVKAISVYL